MSFYRNSTTVSSMSHLHTIEPAMSSCSLNSPEPYTNPNSSMPEKLRLVLVGITGAGKSATGNTILGADLFKSEMCMSSVTKECQMESGVVEGRSLALIDTPGWFDTSLKNEEVEEEVMRCMAMCSPGPHAFLLIIPINTRFTEDQQQMIERFQEAFKDNIADHTIVIFTHADLLNGTSIQRFISKQDQRIQSLVQRFRGRFLAFNNKNPENRTQVMELLGKVDEMLVQNEHRYFTNEKMQAMNKIIEVLEQKQEALTAELIKRAKEDVRNTGQRRRENISKVFEEDMQELERRKQRIQGEINQITEALLQEKERPRPDPHSLRRLEQSLQRKNGNLVQIEEDRNKRVEENEEDLKDLDLWIQEEEKKREEEERKRGSNRARWYQDPFYFKILTYLLVFVGGAGIGFLPMLFGFMAPVAAPTGLAFLQARLAALLGPELLSVLITALTASVRHSAFFASQCSIQ